MRAPTSASDFGAGFHGRRRRLWWLGGVAAAVLVAGAGGGALYLKHQADPLRRADLLEGKGDLRGAVVQLRDAMRGDMRNPALHLRMARLEMKLADPVYAEREFKAAYTLGADRWEVLPSLADAMLAQGHFAETLRLLPVSAPTPERTGQNLYRRAAAHLGQQDISAAAATLALARKTAAGTVPAALIAARVAEAQGDTVAAEAAADAALQQDPAQIDALLIKQQLAALRGDHAAALTLADRAVAADAWSAMARIRRANELIYAKRDDDAKADVDAILQVQPRFVEAVYLDGILLARKGRYQDAAVKLGELDSVLGRFPQALYYQAMVAANLGQLETAVDYARRYNQVVPQDPDGLRQAARLDIAAHDPDHAIGLLQPAIDRGLNDAAAWDLLGSAYGNLGQIKPAIDAFQKALALAPKDGLIRTHLGLAQIQAGQNVMAIGTLAPTGEVEAAEPVAAEALVSAAIGEGDLDRATVALARLRQQVGDTQQVGILQGMIAVRRQDLRAAQTAFAETMQRFPASLSAKLDYARVLVQQGRRMEGMQLMADVLSRSPSNIPALNSYLPLLVQDRHIELAVIVLDAAHKADPRQAGFTATLADALLMVGQAPKAVQMLSDVREAGPLPPVLLAALARAQAAAGLADDAKANFRDVLAQLPDDERDRTGLIDLLLSQHETEAARIELLDGLKRAPGSVRYLSTLVELEAQTKGLDAGLQLAARLRAEPSHLPFATLLKGDALMRAHRFNAAARAYLDEYQAAPAVPPLVRAAAAQVAGGQEEAAAQGLRGWLTAHPNTPLVLNELAKLDLRAGRLADAQAHLEAVLTMLPNDATALNNLAWTYAARGDTRARSTAQRAYLQVPDGDAADTLGWLLLRDGRGPEALPLLQQAADARPSDPAVHYHLAAALDASGQKQQAAPILQAALAQAGPFPERGAAEKLLANLSMR